MDLSTAVARLLIAKLLNYGPLSSEEQFALLAAVSSEREVSPDTDLVFEGASPDHSILMLTGFTARCNLKRDGLRQITSLHIPGDFVDLQSLLIKPMDHSIVALTTCRIASVRHDNLIRISDKFPNLGRALWLNTLVDGGIHRRWSFYLGSFQAYQHLAHMLCELYLRLQQINRTDGNSFHVPLSQALLAECMAITPVHANRAVQKLRSSGFILWERDLITIRNWEGLADLAEFNPNYLRMGNAVIPLIAL